MLNSNIKIPSADTIHATVALEKLKKYYRHANSNAYPITTSKFYLFLFINFNL